MIEMQQDGRGAYHEFDSFRFAWRRIPSWCACPAPQREFPAPGGASGVVKQEDLTSDSEFEATTPLILLANFNWQASDARFNGVSSSRTLTVPPEPKGASWPAPVAVPGAGGSAVAGGSA